MFMILPWNFIPSFNIIAFQAIGIIYPSFLGDITKRQSAMHPYNR